MPKKTKNVKKIEGDSKLSTKTQNQRSNPVKNIEEITIDCSSSAKDAKWIKFKGKPNTKLMLISKGIKIAGEKDLITDWCKYDLYGKVGRIDGILHVVAKTSLLSDEWVDMWRVGVEDKEFISEIGKDILIKMFSPNNGDPKKYQYVADLVTISTLDDTESDKIIRFEDIKSGKIKSSQENTFQDSQEEHKAILEDIQDIIDELDSIVTTSSEKISVTKEPEDAKTDIVSSLMRRIESLEASTNLFCAGLKGVGISVNKLMEVLSMANYISRTENKLLSTRISYLQNENLELKENNSKYMDLIFGLCKSMQTIISQPDFYKDKEKKQLVENYADKLGNDIYFMVSMKYLSKLSHIKGKIERSIKDAHHAIEKRDNDTALNILEDALSGCEPLIGELNDTIGNIDETTSDIFSNNSSLKCIKGYRDRLAGPTREMIQNEIKRL